MQSGGSASPSDVRLVDQTGKRSAQRKGMTLATAVAAAEGIPPAATAVAVGGTPPAATAAAVVDIRLGAVGTPAARARCIRRFAQNAVGTRKFPSSRALTSRSIAASASNCGGQRRPRAITTTRIARKNSERRWPFGHLRSVFPPMQACSPDPLPMRQDGPPCVPHLPVHGHHSPRRRAHRWRAGADH